MAAGPKTLKKLRENQKLNTTQNQTKTAGSEHVFFRNQNIFFETQNVTYVNNTALYVCIRFISGPFKDSGLSSVKENLSCVFQCHEDILIHIRSSSSEDRNKDEDYK